MRKTHNAGRLSRMINPALDAEGKYLYAKWAVRSPNSKGPVEFRIFPQVIDGEIIPQYIDTDVYKDNGEEYISDAALVTEACVCWGENYHTFLSPEPSVLRAAGLPSTPAYTMYWQLYNLKEDRPTECPAAIHALFKYERGKGSQLQRPNEILLFQGVLLEHGGKKTTDKDGNEKPWFPVLLQINQATARKSLLEGLATPKDSSKALSVTNNNMGNLLGLDGCSLRIEPRMVKTQTGDQTHYFTSAGPQMVLADEQVKNNFVPWEDLLHFPEIGQNITYIADAIGAEATVLGLENTPYKPYVPEDVKARAARLSAPTQVAVPAAIPAVAPAPAVQAVPGPITAPATLPPAAPAPAPVAAAPAPTPAPAPAAAPVVAAPAPAPANTLSLDEAVSPDEPALEPFAPDKDIVPDQKALMDSLNSAQGKLEGK